MKVGGLECGHGEQRKRGGGYSQGNGESYCTVLCLLRSIQEL